MLLSFNLFLSFNVFSLFRSFFLSSFLPFLGSGPEGVDDLCFHTYGEFSPSSPPSSPSLYPLQIPVSRPKFQSRGPNPCLNPSLKSWPGDPDPSLEAKILVSRSKSRLRGPGPSLRAHISASTLDKQTNKSSLCSKRTLSRSEPS